MTGRDIYPPASADAGNPPLTDAIATLRALAALIERPPHDDVQLSQAVALRTAAAIAVVLASIDTPSPVIGAADVHSCMACPAEVRSIGAVLHNLVGQLERNEPFLQSRTVRKLSNARDALDRWQPIVDAHFAAIDPILSSETQGAVS